MAPCDRHDRCHARSIRRHLHLSPKESISICPLWTKQICQGGTARPQRTRWHSARQNPHWELRWRLWPALWIINLNIIFQFYVTCKNIDLYHILVLHILHRLKVFLQRLRCTVGRLPWSNQHIFFLSALLSVLHLQFHFFSLSQRHLVWRWISRFS